MLLLWLACASAPPPLDPASALPPCPSSPNCVSSEPGTDPEHSVRPLPAVGQEALLVAIAALPRCEVVRVGVGTVEAVCTTALLRFRDDLRLRVDEAAGVTHVRSSSRLGYGDLGVNRRRVEQLRELLAR